MNKQKQKSLYPQLKYFLLSNKSHDTIFEMSYTHCEKYLRKLNVYDLAFRISVLKILNYMNNIKQ